ncbi:hypothetical protein A2U01_0068672, partial [Trifolium medium]|nr:hypothetical protein [Trifolium medium]
MAGRNDQAIANVMAAMAQSMADANVAVQ